MQFILQLSAGAQPKGDLSTSQQLVELMYCLNLNSTSIYRYIKTAILENSEDSSELDRVRRYIKWLEHRPGYQFVEGRVSLTRMLIPWLELVSSGSRKSGAGGHCGHCGNRGHCGHCGKRQPRGLTAPNPMTRVSASIPEK